MLSKVNLEKICFKTETGYGIVTDTVPISVTETIEKHKEKDHVLVIEMNRYIYYDMCFISSIPTASIMNDREVQDRLRELHGLVSGGKYTTTDGYVKVFGEAIDPVAARNEISIAALLIKSAIAKCLN